MYSTFWLRLAIVTVSIASLSSVSAIEYGWFGGRPAYPKPDNKRSESIFVHELEPGAEKEDGVRVINNTPDKKTFIIFAADSTPSTDGAFACKQFSEEKKDVGSWISIKKTEVTLDPTTNEVIPFTIKVPENAGVWEHNGCILIQEKKSKADGQTGVSLSVRTGIRLAITVPGDIVRKLEITDFTLERTERGIVLHPRVKNTGNVSIDADVSIVTRNMFGFVFMRSGGQYPILRGETSDWNFDLKKPFWGGLYRSKFTVTYDENKEASVGVQSGKELKVLDGPAIWFFSFPTLLGLFVELFIAIMIGIGVFFYMLARKRQEWIKTSWVSYTIKAGDDLKSVAEQFDVSWKLLARVNKIEAPFILKKGQKIQVPPPHQTK